MNLTQIEMVRRLFQMFDIDVDGKISLEEFVIIGEQIFSASISILSLLGGKRSKEIAFTLGFLGSPSLFHQNLQTLFKSLDSNNDNVLTIGEFSHPPFLNWLKSLIGVLREIDLFGKSETELNSITSLNSSQII